MHAIRLHAFGPAENLRHEEVADPEPGPGQVRVAVEAAGVHLLDTALREGFRGPAPTPTDLPTIPGREIAGVVEAVGEGTPTAGSAGASSPISASRPAGTPNVPSPTSTVCTRSRRTWTPPRPSP